MKEYARLYHFYYYPLFFLARIIFVIFLFINCIAFYLNNVPYDKLISIASFILIFEIFFYFKIAQAKPKISIGKGSEDDSDSFTLSALDIFLSSSSIKIFIHNLLKQEDVRFFIFKAEISQKDIETTELDKKLIWEKSKEIVVETGGKFIRNFDLLCAYLLLSEDKTKLLLSKDLNEKDLVNILKWTLLNFPDDSEHGIKFWGNGVADDWVFGWISETKKYMMDLSSQVISKKKFFYPRKEIYRTMLSYLSAFKTVVLVGNPGSGKEALIEQFIKESFEGDLDKKLNHIKVFQFLVDEFLSGAQNQGEIQKRFSSIVEELSHAKDIIVFIENIESILGGSTFNLDLSEVLIPYMRDSKIRIIGTTTPQAYKQYIASKPSFVDATRTIEIDDPGKEEDLLILFEKSSEIERKYHVNISYKAISESLDLGEKYLPQLSSPGSSVTLLDDVSSRAQENKEIDKLNIDTLVEEKTHIPVSAPDRVERKELLNLEPEIHKYIIDQNEAVSAISEAIRRIRSGLSSPNKPISFLFLGPTGVGKTQTAKVLSNIYFNGEREIIRLDMSEYADDQGLEKILGSSSGEFLDKVFNNPFSLILLDEFEKANPRVHNLFLQTLDDGRMTDNSGKTVNFVNTLIIATSNAGSEFIRENISQNNSLPENFDKILTDKLLSQGIFSPELINRFDQIVVFKPLSSMDSEKVSALLLDELKKSLESQEIYLNFDLSLISQISEKGYDPQFGGRPIRRYIQDNIENIISEKIIKGELKKGDNILLSVDNLGVLSISPVSH